MNETVRISVAPNLPFLNEVHEAICDVCDTRSTYTLRHVTCPQFSVDSVVGRLPCTECQNVIIVMIPKPLLNA